MKPLVTVYMTIYNAEKYIERGMKEVLGQTYPNLEFLLIDDGSTDNTAAMLDEYAKNDSRIRVIHQKNLGVSGARNTALDNANGEWVVLIDIDDEIPENSVELLVNTAIEHNVKLCIGSFTIIKQNGNRIERKLENRLLETPDEMYQYFLTDGYDLNYVWGRAYKTEVFKNIRFPLGMSYQDMYVFPYLLKEAGSCYLLSENIYDYYYVAGSITHSKAGRSKQSILARINQYEFYEKEAPKYLPLVKDQIINCCCLSMGMIAGQGRKNFEDEWEYAVSTFSQYKKGAALRRPFEKMASIIFSISPKLLGRLCAIYAKFHNN